MGWAMADGVKRPVSVSVVAVLVLLWSGEASRYFRGLAPDEPVS